MGRIVPVVGDFKGQGGDMGEEQHKGGEMLNH